MPRVARQTSETKIYHCIWRGVNRQKIFSSSVDYSTFIVKLKKFAEICGIEIYAYCLMPNHVHLLFRDPDNNLSTFMQRLGTSYAQYYNRRTQRTGHLFQSRFFSRNIEDESYFRTVYRYILQNPEKAKICRAENYPWSSWNTQLKNEIINTDFIFLYFGSVEFMQDFIKSENTDICDEAEIRIPISDTQAVKIIKKTLSIKSTNQLQSLTTEKISAYLSKLKSLGISKRQIKRILSQN